MKTITAQELLDKYKNAVGVEKQHGFCVITNQIARPGGVMIACMNPSHSGTEDILLDYLDEKCKNGGFWEPKHIMMGKYDRLTAFVDLLPIRFTEQTLVDNMSNSYRGKLLEETQKYLEYMRPKLIIVANKSSLYYWGSNDDATWMGYKLADTGKKLKGKWIIYKILGLKTDKEDRINKEFFNESDNKTNLEGSLLLHYRQVTKWRHPKPEETISEYDIEGLLKEIDPDWEKTLY